MPLLLNPKTVKLPVVVLSAGYRSSLLGVIAVASWAGSTLGNKRAAHFGMPLVSNAVFFHSVEIPQ